MKSNFWLGRANLLWLTICLLQPWFWQLGWLLKASSTVIMYAGELSSMWYNPVLFCFIQFGLVQEVCRLAWMFASLIDILQSCVILIGLWGSFVATFSYLKEKFQPFLTQLAVIIFQRIQFNSKGLKVYTYLRKDYILILLLMITSERFLAFLPEILQKFTVHI